MVPLGTNDMKSPRVLASTILPSAWRKVTRLSVGRFARAKNRQMLAKAREAELP